MDLSIIILNYKTKELIRQQLKAFRSLKMALSYEIIVVDNASDDGIGQLIKDNFPEVVFIQNSLNSGYAAGNNLGLARAQGKYLVVLNPDTVIIDNALERLFDFMEANPEVGIVGPQLLYPNQEIQESYARWPNLMLPLYRRTFLKQTSFGQRWLSHFFYKERDPEKPAEVDWLHGACLLVRKASLVKVGPMDERFWMYLDDTDWCRRFWQAGYKAQRPKGFR